MAKPAVTAGVQIFPIETRKIRAVPVGTKQAVDVSETFIRPVKGIDVLPHHFALVSYLENPAGHALADESIAVGLPLGATDEGTEKLPRWLGLVLPFNLVGIGINLQNSGTWAGRR